MVEAITSPIIETRFPGTFTVEVNDPKYGRYIWFSTDPCFNGVLGSRWVFQGFVNDKYLKGYYRNELPGKECQVGWEFALKIYNTLKKIEGLKFQVTQPVRHVPAPSEHGESFFYIDLELEPIWLGAAIQNAFGLAGFPQSVEIREKFWDEEEFVEKLSDFIGSVWSAYKTHATHWETSAQILASLASLSQDELEPEESIEISGYEARLLVYPDKSLRVLGFGVDGDVDYAVEEMVVSPEQTAEKIASEWHEYYAWKNPE